MAFVIRKMIHTNKDGSYIKNSEVDPYLGNLVGNSIHWSWYQDSAFKFDTIHKANFAIESAYKNYTMPFLIENRLYIEEVP